jgi:cell division protein FtsA
MIEMGEFIFDIPVRRGLPVGSNGKVGGLTDVVKSAAFSTSVGLLLYGLSQKRFSKAHFVQQGEDAIADSINSIGQKVKTFFEDLF